jgi:hypothetical protein
MATDRLTRLTKALVWATGVLALALRMWLKKLFDQLETALGAGQALPGLGWLIALVPSETN